MNDKAIIISYNGWYENRLYYLKNRLEEKGISSTLYVADFSHHQKERIKDKKEYEIYIPVPKYKKNISLKRIYSYYSFAQKISRIIKDEQPKYLYCVIPPNVVSKICMKYKENNPEVKYLIDVIDLWPESFPLTNNKDYFPFSKWKMMRDKSLLLADGVICECNYYSSILPVEIQSKISILRLYKPITEEHRTMIGDLIQSYDTQIKDKKIKICYLGSINNIIDLDSICDVLRALKQNDYIIDFHIIGQGNTKQALLNIAKDQGCNVHYHGAIFENEEKAIILSKCDFGLNLMKPTVKVGLTVKSIDYLLNGLPIISNIPGDTEQLINEEKIGIHYTGDAETLVKRIEFENIKQLKRNAFHCYVEFFSQKSFEHQYESILNTVGFINN